MRHLVAPGESRERTTGIALHVGRRDLVYDDVAPARVCELVRVSDRLVEAGRGLRELQTEIDERSPARRSVVAEAARVVGALHVHAHPLLTADTGHRLAPVVRADVDARDGERDV